MPICGVHHYQVRPVCLKYDCTFTPANGEELSEDNAFYGDNHFMMLPGQPRLKGRYSKYDGAPAGLPKFVYPVDYDEVRVFPVVPVPPPGPLVPGDQQQQQQQHQHNDQQYGNLKWTCLADQFYLH